VPMLVGMLTVALGAIGCTSGKTPPLAARNALADSADQILYHAKWYLTDRGVMKGELHADTAYFFDDNTRMEMRAVETTFFTVSGARNAVLTSREGTDNTRTGNMEARGDVVVVSEDGRRLTTPELRYIQGRNEITSDSAFVLTDSTHRQMTGIGFESDPDMNNVRCFRACAGTAGIVTLPGTAGDSVRPAAPSTRAVPSAGQGAAPPAPSAGARPARVPPRPPTPTNPAPRAKTFTLPGHGTP
jgi:LPS export ABC transporter protein LptC